MGADFPKGVFMYSWKKPKGTRKLISLFTTRLAIFRNLFEGHRTLKQVQRNEVMKTLHKSEEEKLQPVKITVKFVNLDKWEELEILSEEEGVQAIRIDDAILTEDLTTPQDTLKKCTAKILPRVIFSH